MINMTDKINCPHCDYPIPADEVICPVCDKIIANAPSEVEPHQGTSGEIGKTSTSSPYLYMYTTNPKIIILLTFMFCLGVWLFFLFYAIEYRPNPPRRRHYSSRISTRQAYTLIVGFISVFFTCNNPFQNHKFLPQRLLKGKRVATLVSYVVGLLVLVLFWHFYVSDFILNDLNDFYYDKFYNEALKEELFVNKPEGVTIENASEFIDNASILAEEPAKLKTEPYVRRAFIFYKATYLLCVALIYLPFIFYYGFNLDFVYYDVKPYKKNFQLVFSILLALIFLYYLYKKSDSLPVFLMTLLLIGITAITRNDFKSRMIFIFSLAIAIFAFIIYTSF